MKKISVYQKHHEKFNSCYNEYLNKFANNSLDRGITHDPIYFLNYTEDEINELMKPLENAILTNTPLEQIDEQIWKNLIF